MSRGRHGSRSLDPGGGLTALLHIIVAVVAAAGHPPACAHCRPPTFPPHGWVCKRHRARGYNRRLRHRGHVYYCKRVRRPPPIASRPPIPAVTTIVAAPPADTTPPAPPREPTVTPAGREIALAWPANADSDLDHYRVYRRDADRGWAPIASTSTPSSTDTNVQWGTV